MARETKKPSADFDLSSGWGTNQSIMLLTALSVLATQQTPEQDVPDSLLHSIDLDLSRHHHHHPYCDDATGTLYGVMPSVRIVAAITCALSMIGALLIILSYILIPEIRTKAREVLVNLSLMDFMAATSNLVGVTANFNGYLGPDHPVNISNHTHNTINNLCIAQATFAMYGTVSSVLWTICLAVYVFLRIMLEGRDVARKSVVVLYVISYGIPLGLTLWFVGTHRLGYAPYGGSGWCSLTLSDPNKVRNIYAAVFGNDLWIYLTIILVPLIFVSLHFYLRSKMKSGRAILTKNQTSIQSVEIKLLVIPIFFILLRIWSLLLVILKLEAGVKLSCTAILFFLHIGGIGDSGQGLANAILFVLFTPKVRHFYLKCLLRLFLCCRRRKGHSINQPGQSNTPYYGSIASDSLMKEGSSHAFSRSGSHSSADTQDRKSLLLNTAP